MYTFCLENLSGIHFIYVPSEEVQSNSMKLQRRFDYCKQIPQTRSFHRFVPLTQTKIICYIYSQSGEFTDCSTTEIPEESIFSLKIQDTVAVSYTHLDVYKRQD